MNLAEFIEFAKKNDEADYSILGDANAEYAREGNKFENFDTIAEIFKRIVPGFENLSARHVAIIYGLKHFISVMKGTSIRESMKGRFSDVRNYVRLIEGIDERDNNLGV